MLLSLPPRNVSRNYLGQSLCGAGQNLRSDNRVVAAASTKRKKNCNQVAHARDRPVHAREANWLQPNTGYNSRDLLSTLIL